MPKSELDKAIAKLTELYDKALQNEQIHNPIAYALYHTWKEFDDKVKRPDPYGLNG